MSKSVLDTIKNIGIGAGAAVVTVTALPIAGPVGTITAAGSAVASIVGGIGGLIDSVED